MDRPPEISAAAFGPAAPLLLCSAKLFTIDGRMMVTVLEMSDDDAVATTAAPPPAGSIAVLARSGIRVAATIAWVDGQRFGLRLDEPLDDSLMQRFAGTARAVAERPALAMAAACAA